jgi:hypothetical protein
LRRTTFLGYQWLVLASSLLQLARQQGERSGHWMCTEATSYMLLRQYFFFVFCQEKEV